MQVLIMALVLLSGSLTWAQSGPPPAYNPWDAMQRGYDLADGKAKPSEGSKFALPYSSPSQEPQRQPPNIQEEYWKMRQQQYLQQQQLRDMQQRDSQRR